jgi:limonene-1,2-epoxide hydrolase
MYEVTLEMSKPDPRDVVLKYVEAINTRDPQALMALQTEDFTFINYEGEAYVGRAGWQDYFTSYPEYKIHVDRLVTSGNGVAIIGRTTGCHVGPEVEARWTVLWTAEVRKGFIAEWRIYSDVEDVQRRIRKAN